MTPVGTLRIGVDAGGTFTHAVGVRTSDGAVFGATVPSTPADPSQASGLAIRRILDGAGCRPADVSVLVYAATPVANAFLAGELPRLGLVVTAGFRHLLEVGRQGLPEGAGAPFHWVKPPPPVPRERVFEVGGRLDPRGEEVEPLDEAAAAEAARALREAGAEAVGVCLIHACANPDHERRVRAIFEREFPGCALSISSDVLPEPREAERAEAALADAACKVLTRRAFGGAAERAARALSEETSFLLMKSNGAVIRAREAFERPLAAVLAGPAAGALAGASLARAAGLRKVIAFNAGGGSTEVSLIEDGALAYRPAARLGGWTIASPAIDLAAAAAGGGSIARAEAGGRLRLGPRGAGAEPGPMCFGRGGEEPTLTDALLFLGRLPGALGGDALPLDRDRAGEGMARLAEALGTDPEEAAFRVLEEAVRAQAAAVGEMTLRRGKDPADYALLAFGGLGPATAAEAAAPLGIREVVIPPRPCSESAAGLVETERRNEYSLPHVARLEGDRLDELERLYAGMERDAAADLDAEAAPGEARTLLRAAEMRYRGDGWKMTIELPPAPSFAASVEGAVACYHEAYRFRFGFDHRGRTPVETLRLRLTALGRMAHPPRPAFGGAPGAGDARRGERPAALARGRQEPVPVFDRGGLAPGDAVEGPALIEEAGATAWVPPGCACRVDAGGSLRIALPAPAEEAGPSPVSRGIVEGALLTAEREMEALLREAARSPFIRDMGVCRAAVFDARGRRLTGRAPSPPAAPVLEAFPPEAIRAGDVFLWNDAYAPGGGTGRLSELCCCVPVIHRRRLVALALVAGQHEDIGGTAPGGLPVGASQAFQEGILIPPIKLYDRGVPNEAARRLILRNNRKGEDVGADIEAQIAACRAGAARIAGLFARYHTRPVHACFEAILGDCARAVGEEILPRVPEGAFAWEDHVESDGVDTHKVHTLRIRMSKEAGRLRLDFRGTGPQARGPINWPANRDGGTALKRWLAPLLTSLAADPARRAGIEVNDGALDLIEVALPEPGSLITPAFPASTNMGAITLGRLRGLLLGVLGLATGGQMPADQENLHWWGLRGRDPAGRFFLFREILGGGTGARPWGDGEDALLAAAGMEGVGAEYLEARFPVRVERVGLAEDSGGPGRRRGGLGMFRELRVLCDCEVLGNAGRAFLAPWGARGGRAGGRFSIVVNPGSAVERAVPALSAGVYAIEGDRLRVTTTGGGGWGDPYEREVERVAEDVAQGRVSIDGSMRHYGVVFTAEETPRLDLPGTQALRQFMRARRGKPPFFDHGPNAAALKK